MENNGNGKKQEHRTTALEVTVKSLCVDMVSVKADVKAILTNHLPHIQAELTGLKTEIKDLRRNMKWWFAGVIGVIIVDIIIKLLG